MVIYSSKRILTQLAARKVFIADESSLSSSAVDSCTEPELTSDSPQDVAARYVSEMYGESRVVLSLVLKALSQQPHFQCEGTFVEYLGRF